LGGFAARAAASIAVTRIVVITLERTGVGGIDGDIGSINAMMGLQGSDPNGFPFASVGLASVICGSAGGCGHQTGIAFDAGYHGGWKYGGGSVVAFVTRAHRGRNSSGVVVTLDLGWFGPRR
jgi:hypothetical protein